MAQINLWILNGRVPEACLDCVRWMDWFDRAIANNETEIARTILMDGDLLIATRFHGFMELNGKFEPPPMLFETVVLGDAHIGELMGLETTRRDRIDVRSYPTWEAAVKGHHEVTAQYRAMVDVVKGAAIAAIPCLAPRAQPGGRI